MLKKKLDIFCMRVLLTLTIICIPFVNFPFELPIINNNLPDLWILLLVIVFLYHILFGTSKIEKNEQKIWYYFAFLLIWNCGCTIIGVIGYDYYDLIPVSDVSSVIPFVQFLSNYGIDITQIEAMKFWLCLRYIKLCLFEALFSYVITIIVYHIYIHNWRKGFSDFRQSIFILTFMLICFSVIEVGYLLGNEFCKNGLMNLTPLYMKIATSNHWWPPLLWKGQLRSLFAEPSFLGIGAVVIVPFLISYILKFFKMRDLLCYILLGIMLFLTKARTAVLLFIGQIGIVFLYGCIINKILFKRIMAIILCTVIAFFISLNIISHENNTTSVRSPSGVSSYVNENVVSITGQKRSNVARFIYLKSTIKVIEQHPWFGVGNGLQAAYINDNLTEADFDDNEVKNWSQDMKNLGVLHSGFPVLNGFSHLGASYGIIGLILYFFPAIYIVYLFIIKRRNLQCIEGCCLFIAYVGTIVAMFSNIASMPYYILTALSFSYLNSDRLSEDEEVVMTDALNN